ncbi:uncharacterized protein PV09_01615 [Verruconis gallopava]|uniref:Uncharacterized protein n=1 Tax=Verruconis gallopava TaxID=253628 RepID=A0A0D2AMH3_9PEZI|nr:uncharacterized protein PV09_01615 [Verruconis gallopava]KIW07675.1 hypothetical protein PV09_01615 [Verruconis gallopava]
MATQRRTRAETPAEKDLAPKDGPSDIRPAVPTEVIVKLLGFTFAMIVLPIGSYFATVNTVFKGNSTFAGALAAVVANVVLIGYVIVAVREDQSESTGLAAKKGKKAE